MLFTIRGTPLVLVSRVRNGAKLTNTLLADAFRFITLKTSIMQMKIHRPSTLDCRDRASERVREQYHTASSGRALSFNRAKERAQEPVHTVWAAQALPESYIVCIL